MEIEFEKPQKGSKHEIIADFIKVNNLTNIDLEMYLNVQGVVCVTIEDYNELSDTE